MYSIKLHGLTLATITIFISIFKPEGLPDSVRLGIQLTMMSISLLYVLTMIKEVSWNSIITIEIPIIISSVFAYLVKEISFLSLMNCLFYMAALCLMSILLGEWVNRRMFFRLLSPLQAILYVYCILSFVSIVIKGTTDSATTKYFFGGKFITTYYYVMLLGIVYARNRAKIEKRKCFFAFFLLECMLVFIIEVYLKCTTGMIVVCFFPLAVFIPKIMRTFFVKKSVLVCAMLVSGILPVCVEGILSLRFVKFVIVELLGKTITLTDRLPIYTTHLLPLIREKILFGHGYANSAMYLKTEVYWNAQNGIFDLILNYGVVGCCFIIFTVYKVAEDKYATTVTWPIYVVLYSFIFAATIEVSYDMEFFFLLLLLSAVRIRNKKVATMCKINGDVNFNKGTNRTKVKE